MSSIETSHQVDFGWQYQICNEKTKNFTRLKYDLWPIETLIRLSYIVLFVLFETGVYISIYSATLVAE